MEPQSKYPYTMKRTCEWCDKEYTAKIENFENVRCRAFCTNECRRASRSESCRQSKLGNGGARIPYRKKIEALRKKKVKAPKIVKPLLPHQVKDLEYHRQLRLSYGLEVTA